MLFGCSSLKKLNISNFNTQNVKHMSNIFNHCYSLKDADDMEEKLKKNIKIKSSCILI